MKTNKFTEHMPSFYQLCIDSLSPTSSLSCLCLKITKGTASKDFLLTTTKTGKYERLLITHHILKCHKLSAIKII